MNAASALGLPLEQLWLLGIALITGVGGATWYFAPTQRRRRVLRRALRRALPWPIAELPEGVIGRVTGHARILDGTLVAPLSGRRCVAYEIVLAENTHNSHREIAREARGVPFLLEDDSGRAVIDPADAAYALDLDRRATGGGEDTTRPELAAMFERLGLPATLGTRRKIALREGVIEAGERVSVLGVAAREPDPTAAPAGYRDAAPTRLRLAGSRRDPLVISDHPSAT